MACEPHFVVKYSSYLGTAIKLVLYILKQLFASVSVNSGGYLPRRSGSVNIHRYSPPLRRIIVNYYVFLFFRPLFRVERELSSIEKVGEALVHSHVQGVYTPNLPKEKCTIDVVRIGSIIIFH